MAEVSLIAFVVHILIIVINNIFLANNEFISLIVSEIGTIAFFGILGLAGLIVAIKQEFPQAVMIRGKWAVINGIIWCAVSWLLMLRYFYYLITDVTKYFFSN